MGSGSNQVEIDRLLEEVALLVEVRVPRKLSPPSLLTVRTVHSNSTEHAESLAAEQLIRATDLLNQMLAMGDNGVRFSAPRSQKMSKWVPAAAAALDGVSFVEDDTQWKVLDVAYCKHDRLSWCGIMMLILLLNKIGRKMG